MNPTAKTIHAKSILDAIGNTPLLKVGDVYAKLETTNPTGSVKDRMAWYIMRNAEKRGELRRGATILEVTSGNTGISFSMLSAVRGYKFIAVMPESASRERIKMMDSFGATAILTPAEEDMAGAFAEYKKLVKEMPNAWLPRQFENPDNINAHIDGLGKEIIEQTGGNVDALIAGVGTGGTLIGTAIALKKANPDVKIIGVEPAESAVMSGGKPGTHGIQGIGEGFIPPLVKKNLKLIDEVIKIKTKDAIMASKELAKKRGLLVGISSGANMLAAEIAKKKHRYKNIVTILPDRGERYFSCDMK